MVQCFKCKAELGSTARTYRKKPHCKACIEEISGIKSWDRVYVFSNGDAISCRISGRRWSDKINDYEYILSPNYPDKMIFVEGEIFNTPSDAIKANMCKTAPFPKCNNGEGCDECEYRR